MSDEQVCTPGGGSFRRESLAPKVSAEAQAVIDAANAQTAQAEATNETSLRSQADTALANLRAYRDLASPTNAQTVAAVKLLCRVAIALIRLVLRKLDSID